MIGCNIILPAHIVNSVINEVFKDRANFTSNETIRVHDRNLSMFRDKHERSQELEIIVKTLAIRVSISS